MTVKKSDKSIIEQKEQNVEKTSSSQDIANFIAQAKNLSRPSAPGENGRLVFALDATMSRQPTWDIACELQAEMFEEAGRIGGLDIQLVYFRGFNECRSSKWVKNANHLSDLMSRIDCRGGKTQIGKVLQHVRRAAKEGKISALAFIGDAMEEDIDDLCHKAGEIGLLGVPAFMFQEGRKQEAELAFKEIARLTRGAYFRFDDASAQELRNLLKAVAIFATGGRIALEDHNSSKSEVKALLSQLPK